MVQELIFSAPKHENMCEWGNGAAWLEHCVNVHTTQQPNRVIEEPHIKNIQIYNNNLVHDPSKDSKSDSEQKTWSLDKAIHKVFRLEFQESDRSPA